MSDCFGGVGGVDGAEGGAGIGGGSCSGTGVGCCFDWKLFLLYDPSDWGMYRLYIMSPACQKR